jgi:ribosomal protein L32
MSNFEKGNAADAPARKYFYSVCKNCGSKLHIDNRICGTCGKRYKDFGEIPRLYETDEDPGVYRHNIDHPEGCPACAASCGYCHSFGLPFPSPKANCGECGKWRAACCKKARKLPALGDVMPGVPVADILARRKGLENVFEAYRVFFAEKVAGCRSHVPDAGNAAPHERSA